MGIAGYKEQRPARNSPPSPSQQTGNKNNKKNKKESLRLSVLRPLFV